MTEENSVPEESVESDKIVTSGSLGNQDSVQDRRSFFRKLVAVAAVTGISGSVLAKLAEPVSAASSGEVTFYTGSSAQSGSPNLYWDNVNYRLGIDTTSPENYFHIYGPANADVFAGMGPHPNTLVSGVYTGPAMNFGYSGNSFGEGSGFFNVRPDPSATGINPSLRFMTNNVVAMTITNSQYVGIGTSTPGAQLDVETASIAALQSVTTNGASGIQVSGDAGAHIAAITTDQAYGNYIWIGRGSGGLYGGVYGDIRIGNGTNPGLVGIGTTPSSDTQLYVNTGETTGIDSYSSDTDGTGILGECDSGSEAWGVAGFSSTGYAGYFAGAVYVSGLLTKAGGGFLIDDPVDPANKLLYHSFVESPDMKNLYDGVATLDGNGNATVQLPDYFDALNDDFRYQLTAIGGSMPNLYIASQVSGNQFKISGGTANGQVSWAVTGIRQDPWANANRLVPEVDKTAAQVNTYVNPELYGKPASQSMFKQPPSKTPSGPTTSTGTSGTSTATTTTSTG